MNPNHISLIIMFATTILFGFLLDFSKTEGLLFMMLQALLKQVYLGEKK